MPRCGSLPRSSRHTALPTTAPGNPADHSPQHLPLPLGCQKGTPLGRGSGGLYHGANPQQGAPGPPQGQMTPAQVPCPRKLEGHVSISGVTPDMHPCTVASLSTWSSLQGSLFPCNLLQILLQMPPLDRLDLEPLAGPQGPQLWLHGHRVSIIASCRSGPCRGRQHHCSQASSLLCGVGVEPGTGSRALQENL